MAAAPRGLMHHVVAELLAQEVEDAAVEQAITPVIAALTDAGVTVLADAPQTYARDEQVRDLTDLTDPAGARLDENNHADCPGHIAWVTAEYYPAESDEDIAEEVEVTIGFGCTDYLTHGHHSTRWTDRHRAVDTSTAADASDLDVDGAAGRVAIAADESAQAKREERRLLIARNKQSDAAQTVRREFVRQSLTVKSRAKAMAGWALGRVVERDRTYTQWTHGNYSVVLGELLGGQPRQVIADAPQERYPLLMWAQVCAAHEDSFPRDAHRHIDTGHADYLRHLSALGYPSAKVDQEVIDQACPPKAYDDPEPIVEQSADGQPAESEFGDQPPANAPADDQDQEVTAA